MKAYFAINENQYKILVGTSPPQKFRPSVVVTDIPCYDKTSGDFRDGILVLPVSDERPISIDLDANEPKIFKFGDYGSDGTLFNFIIEG